MGQAACRADPPSDYFRWWVGVEDSLTHPTLSSVAEAAKALVGDLRRPGGTPLPEIRELGASGGLAGRRHRGDAHPRPSRRLSQLLADDPALPESSAFFCGSPATLCSMIF